MANETTPVWVSEPSLHDFFDDRSIELLSDLVNYPQYGASISEVLEFGQLEGSTPDGTSEPPAHGISLPVVYKGSLDLESNAFDHEKFTLVPGMELHDVVISNINTVDRELQPPKKRYRSLDIEAHSSTRRKFKELEHGNNPFGRAGNLRCEACRNRRIKVDFKLGI